MNDTIFALSTPPGRSGVAVVRVSGPDAWMGAKTLANKDFKARHVQLCALKDPRTAEIIDHALVVCFRGPASFTGEDIVEYNVHGGPAVIQSLLAALGRQERHRMAEPGEFTRRAFENGKLDLTAAEAIADLINAETQAQKIQALAQMDGSLARLYAAWTEDLKTALAHLEADIEFPDEDLPGGITPEIISAIKKLGGAISEHLNDNRRGERLRSGLQVAVIGAPNAGKSSLVNALAQRDVAIVSDVAGTTRDVIEAHLDLGGYPVIVADTAGLRPAQMSESGQDKIESEGMRRALQRARDADIKILLFDGTQKDADENTLALRDENSLLVINKADQKILLKSMDGAIEISVASGRGLENLTAALVERAKNMIGAREAPALTRARHRRALEDAHTALNRATFAGMPELMAEDLRLAVRAIGRITGRVDVEDLLDVIFRDFCIGK
jgi:tRNA modification GTPase